jgi:tripeptide aminopeptidase
MWITILPTFGFISHFDTTPDFTGANVNLKLYPIGGKDIILVTEQNIILSPISKIYYSTKDKP